MGKFLCLKFFGGIEPEEQNRSDSLHPILKDFGN